MIGLTSITFRNKNVREIINFAKRAKLDGIEWGSDVHVREGDIVTASRVRGLTISAGLQVLSYGTYYRLGDNQNFALYLDSAIALGAKKMRIWAGGQSPQDVSDSMRAEMVRDARKIAQQAQKRNIEICFEYHRKTLTENKESALQLLHEVNEPNVSLYWQSNPDLSESEKWQEIDFLKKYIQTVHCFYWTPPNIRHLMRDGEDNWREYIKRIGKDAVYLLEFTPGNSTSNAFDDISILKELLHS